MGPGCSFNKAFTLYSLHPHMCPSSTASSLSAVVSRNSSFLPTQHRTATASRALLQQDDQKQDTGGAHLVWDSPHLAWSKSPSPPPVVSQERPAEADLSRSRADVRRRSGVSHLGCARNTTAHPSDSLGARWLSLTLGLPQAAQTPDLCCGRINIIPWVHISMCLLLFPAASCPQLSGTSLTRVQHQQGERRPVPVALTPPLPLKEPWVPAGRAVAGCVRPVESPCRRAVWDLCHC